MRGGRHSVTCSELLQKLTILPLTGELVARWRIRTTGVYLMSGRLQAAVFVRSAHAANLRRTVWVGDIPQGPLSTVAGPGSRPRRTVPPRRILRKKIARRRRGNCENRASCPSILTIRDPLRAGVDPRADLRLFPYLSPQAPKAELRELLVKTLRWGASRQVPRSPGVLDLTGCLAGFKRDAREEPDRQFDGLGVSGNAVGEGEIRLVIDVE